MRKALLTVTFAVCVVAACTRGVLETSLGKQVAYVGQALAMLAFVVALLMARGTNRPGQARRVWTVYLFLLVAMVSAAYVTVVKASAAGWIYVGVMAFFAVTILVLSSREAEDAGDVPVAFWLGLAGIASVTVGFLQQGQLLLDTFPGSDLASMGGLVRPSSMTGNYLHYPLFIAMLVFVFMEFWSSRKRPVYAVLAGLFAIAIVVSFSRSGAMILALGFVAYVFTARRLSTRIRYVYWGSGLLLAGAAVFSGTVYAERILGSLSVDAAGNEGRVTKWFQAAELWSDSPLVIGGWTGMYTNVTENFGGGSAGVVESGFFQQLVSFGVLGVVLFYLIMSQSIWAVDRSHSWLRAGLIGGMLETFVYQSIEVIPFMALYALAPFISTHLLQRAGRTAPQAALPADSHTFRGELVHA
ncbi:hypothetical protein C8K30_104229 [Promicromonospora sp. AC04]|uniref:O-antigen ligase family protein n=1 Tax=Promicromonospora sp. AC04 TaxID=2135723 RepID=UPI000D3D8C7A|nr:hypothetical protein [Promicromonospora sp. AC04]PUB27779.1 hypothetical protein C8K30_104229 [Promicromonospora sp. AC04]